MAERSTAAKFVRMTALLESKPMSWRLDEQYDPRTGNKVVDACNKFVDTAARGLELDSQQYC
jgi:hypothetical protein